MRHLAGAPCGAGAPPTPGGGGSSSGGGDGGRRSVWWRRSSERPRSRTSFWPRSICRRSSVWRASVWPRRSSVSRVSRGAPCSPLLYLLRIVWHSIMRRAHSVRAVESVRLAEERPSSNCWHSIIRRAHDHRRRHHRGHRHGAGGRGDGAGGRRTRSTTALEGDAKRAGDPGNH